MANTPWGISDYKRKVATGIKFYSTPGHGGFKVNKKQLSMMPKHLQNEDGWYEEDCEWSKVALAFPQYFAESIEQAKETFNNWFNPDGTYKR